LRQWKLLSTKLKISKMYIKRTIDLLVISILVIFGIPEKTQAQNKQASATEVSDPYSEVSFKKNKVPEPIPVRWEDIIWQREVYRTIDLSIGQNTTLYYPVEPSGDKMNLFSMIFDIVANGKVTVYEYLDGKEVFTNQYAVKFKDILKRFEIPYKEVPDPKNINANIYEIEAVDIPSSEVTLFYVKELWFLDKMNSSLKVKTLALCPVLIREDETGETRRLPMFWIPFESLKPFLSQIPVAVDSLNSARRLSIYDYFNQRRYNGDIYKVSNLKNQTIWDYCTTPEAIKAEQERLEKGLENIDSTLWEPGQKQFKENSKSKKPKEEEIAKEEKKKKGKNM
jgi:gliding motility associated protien GldN